MCLPVVSLFCHPRNHSFGRAEQADTVSKDCSRKITKKNWEALVMEHFLCKVVGTELETFYLKRNIRFHARSYSFPCAKLFVSMREAIQNNFFVENF